MNNRIQFTKEDISKAAFELAKEEGLQSMSARKIAKKAGSSTAPVYSCFDSMEALEKDVLEQVSQLFYDYTKRGYSDNEALSVGAGVIMFAKENKELFKSIFVESNQYEETVNRLFDTIDDHFKTMEYYDKLPDEERRYLLKKLWIVTRGLASEACAGYLDDVPDEEIKEILKDIGSGVIDKTFSKYWDLEKIGRA